MQYDYEIVDDKIHIVKDDGATEIYWPEELIRTVEAQRTDENGRALATILAEVLEEYPEIFTCDYNSDLVM